MTKFKGELTDFTIVQLAIAREYAGWTLKYYAKLTRLVYTVLAHGEAMYSCDTLDLVCELMNINLAEEKKIRSKLTEW